MPDWSTAEWAQVVATIAAAIAAVASCVAAGVSLRQQRRSLKPNLSAGLTRGTLSGRLGASFFNNGPGVAVQVMYMLVVGGHTRYGVVNRGHLGVGERAELDFQLLATPNDEAYFMWGASDVEWNVYIWSIHWQARRYSRRKWLRKWPNGRPSIADQFQLVYPNVALPVAGSTKSAGPDDEPNV